LTNAGKDILFPSLSSFSNSAFVLENGGYTIPMFLINASYGISYTILIVSQVAILYLGTVLSSGLTPDSYTNSFGCSNGKSPVSLIFFIIC